MWRRHGLSDSARAGSLLEPAHPPRPTAARVLTHAAHRPRGTLLRTSMRRLLLAAGIALLSSAASAAAQPVLVGDALRHGGAVVRLPSGLEWNVQHDVDGVLMSGESEDEAVIVVVVPMNLREDLPIPRDRLLDVLVTEMPGLMRHEDLEMTPTPEASPVGPAGMLVRGFHLQAKAAEGSARGWFRFYLAESGPVTLVMIGSIRADVDPYHDASVRKMMHAIAFERPASDGGS